METLKQFGLDPEQIIGYFYSALLAMILIHQFDQAALEGFEKIFVTELIYFFAFFIFGIFLFVLYFNFFGKYFLYKIFYFIHSFLDKKQKRITSTIGYLKSIGVKKELAKRAYEDIKNGYFKDPLKLKLLVTHGETHIFYITTSQCLVTIIYMLFSSIAFKDPRFIIIGVITIVSFLAAITIDKSQHSYETTLMKSFFEKGDLKEFLEQRNYI